MMNIIKIEKFEVISDEAQFFKKILGKEGFIYLPSPIFERQKRYRIIKGYEVGGRKFFVKEYLSCFEEGDKEWENLLFLKKLGFKVPKPFFRLKSSEKYLLATFALEGLPLSVLLTENQGQEFFLLPTLGELLANLHKHKLYHQDCYLNHFYWDEATKTLGFLDVSRVVSNPCFSLRYQIKDLAQVGYSFEEYLGDKGKLFFQKFLFHYFGFLGINFSLLLRFLLEFKIWLIRRRTERARKKGKEL